MCCRSPCSADAGFETREKALEIAARLVEKTRSESNCLYYGWTISGDKLFCREAYTDGEGMAAHLANVGSILGEMLDGAAKLEKLDIHATLPDIEKVRESMTGVLSTAGFYETVRGGFARVENWGSFDFITIQPTFTIKDAEKAKGIMDRFVAATESEAGAIWYGWTVARGTPRSPSNIIPCNGDKLYCREAYVDGDAVLAHLDNVGALLGELLDGAATLESLEIHGPVLELEKLKGKVPPVTVFYETVSGFTQ